MNASSKKILMAVILVFVLANAFFAAYYITLKKAPDGEGTVAPAVTDMAAPAGQTSAETGGVPQQTNAAGNVIPTAGTDEITGITDPSDGVTGLPQQTTAADMESTAAATTAAAPQANGGDVSAPTYIGGILVVNKSYPLPRSYDPGGLTGECESAFYEMQAAAEKEGLNLYIASGFRSYDLQASLYQRYCNEDGQAAADTYSARPGHSEHQSGLAIDLNSISSDFAYTAEGKWVAEHCWEYGFILRYPADKVSITGYMYEPWHIRYLGKSTAAAVYQSGQCLEEYLGIDSVYSY